MYFHSVLCMYLSVGHIILNCIVYITLYVLLVMLSSVQFQCGDTCYCVPLCWLFSDQVLMCCVLSVPSLVLTILLAFVSVSMTIAQPLFQISLATGYDDELEQCKDTCCMYVHVCVCVGVCVCAHMRVCCVVCVCMCIHMCMCIRA